VQQILCADAAPGVADTQIDVRSGRQ
jgi:hypothetical protein